MSESKRFNVLGNISAAEFLTEYWQKKPLLVRQAIPEFVSPVSADELAGLACLDDVESRIVLEKDGVAPWELRHGPFDEDEFSHLPDTHWTLLVQECNRHIPELAALLDQFNFIPSWRVDDVMVSYAAPQGSVGPHVDQYDVFLLQGQGTRRWQINSNREISLDFLPNTELRILRDFNVEQEWLVEPGDILYLPPGVAHYGVAQNDCITLSIGFRAPSHYDLLTAFAEDQFADISDPFLVPRYQDPDLVLEKNNGEISNQALQAIVNTLQSYTSDAHNIKRWFGRYITEPKYRTEIEQLRKPYSITSLQKALQNNELVVRSENSRYAYIKGDESTTYLYINGTEYELRLNAQLLAPLICNQRHIDSNQLGIYLQAEDCSTLLVELFNSDSLYFNDAKD